VNEDLDFQLERAQGIGGSDVGAMYSIGYSCRRQLQYEKNGEEMDFPPVENSFFVRGHLLEPVIRSEYKKTAKGTVIEPPLFYQHPEYPWMCCHPDALLQTDTMLKVVEIKALGRGNFMKQRREGLDHEYILQMQHNLLVTGCDAGEFAIQCVDPWQREIFSVDRDPEITEQLITDEAEFWRQVENGPLADKLDPGDPRCQSCPYRVRCQGNAILDAPTKLLADGIEVDDSLAPLLTEYADAGELVDAAADLVSEKKEALELALLSRPAVRVNGRVIQRIKYPVERWDTAALDWLMARPGAAAFLKKYRKKSMHSRLTVSR
jgi:hypothetical protein